MITASGTQGASRLWRAGSRAPAAPSAPLVRAEGLEDHPDHDRAEDGDDDRGEDPGALPEAELTGDPATDDRAEDPDDDVREAAAGGPAANERSGQGARKEPDDDPVEEVEEHQAESAIPGSARKAARSGSGMPTISRMNVASASSRSPAATSASTRRNVRASGSW